MVGLIGMSLLDFLSSSVSATLVFKCSSCFIACDPDLHVSVFWWVSSPSHGLNNSYMKHNRIQNAGCVHLKLIDCTPPAYLSNLLLTDLRPCFCRWFTILFTKRGDIKLLKKNKPEKFHIHLKRQVSIWQMFDKACCVTICMVYPVMRSACSSN